MIEVDQNLEAAGDDLVRFFPFDIGDETYTARVMFMTRVIKALPRRKIEQNSTSPTRP
ncbi:MAG TPA: hypothetical protein VG939_01390 [Caulobacteraceae bacterium]|nr:hypothetical protein [Caulobacteraceae bacterium]